MEAGHDLGFTEQEVQHAAKQFARVDKDGSGFLEKREIEQVLEDLKFDADEAGIEQAMAIVDIERNGKLNAVEFLFLKAVSGQ